jgi:hypothetical protein
VNYLAKYIGREKLYSRVKGLGYMLPDMDAMLYSKLVGIEWLELEHIELSSQQTGNWIKIYNKDTCKNDVFTWEDIIHEDDYPHVMAHFEAYVTGKSDVYQILKLNLLTHLRFTV